MKLDEARKIIRKVISSYLEENDEEEKFLYPGVEEDLPEQLKSLVDEFRELPLEEREEIPLLWWMLKKSTANFKMSKEGSDYTDDSASEEQYCSNCSRIYMSHGGFICDWVGKNKEGNDNIQLGGWCKFWEKSNDGRDLTDKMKKYL